MRAAPSLSISLLALASATPWLAACGDHEKPSNTATTQPAPGASVSPTPGRSRGALSLASTTHDFGLVDDTRLLSCEFAFENTGSDTLRIREMKSSCGCTTPELEKMSFAPGEGDTVRVEWKPKGHGHQVQTVDLFIEGRPSPERLTVRALVEPRIRLAPLTADFGKIPRHTQRSMVLTLKSDDPRLEVLSVTPKVPTAVLANFVPAGSGTTLGTLNVQLLPREPGAFGSAVTIQSRVYDSESGEPYEYEMDVAVRASIYGAVQLEPNAFYVGKVDPRGAVDYRVRLRRPDGTPFGVHRAELIQCTVEGLRVVRSSGADGEGSYVDLTLEGNVGEYLGPLRGKVALLTDVQGDSLQALPIMGVVR